MRRALLGGVLAVAASSAALFLSGGPAKRLWVTHPAAREKAALCVSGDCGPWAVTLNWALPSFAGTTGYNLYLNGTQVGSASASPFTFSGSDCGVTNTLGVRAHNAGGGTGPLYTTNYTAPACSGTFPLQVSANGRFLRTAGGQPWLMVGDSPQTIVGNLSEANAANYFTDRASHGFNTVWINLLCDDYTACAANGQTSDGVAPFTSGTTPSTYTFGAGQCGNCNTTYFTRAHNMIAQAKADGLTVVLDPISTDGCTAGKWYTTLLSNGDGTVSTTDADYRYGQFLGNEFKDLNNIVWMSGNDYQCFATAGDDADVLSVANGIRNTDPSALQTSELAFNFSTSLDDTTHDWTGVLGMNGVYSYFPAYNEVAHAYTQTPTMPSIEVEGSYEGQGFGAGGTPQIVRLQEWWAATSGVIGQLYGGPCYGMTNSTVLSSCDTAGVAQLGYLTGLLQSRNWQDLAPDSGHTLVFCGTSGTTCGSCPSNNVLSLANFATTNCVTDVETADNKTAFVYLPQGGTITVNLAGFATTVTARWLDPTNNTFSSITGSPFANSGTHNFTPTGNNAAGNPDWVLVLEG